MEKERPYILITNDDSIYSKGIKALVETASEFGEVIVVAPDKPHSGKSNAITLDHPLRVNKSNIFGDSVVAYTCSGTPVDCVKIALNKIVSAKPDLCLSGINHGSNAALNVLYSGTMGAATEAALDGVNSIGFSSLDFDHKADMSVCQIFARKIIKECLEKGFPECKLLNVNIPFLPENEIKGFRICRQANATWKEDFEERTDPFNRKYYWLTGEFVNYDVEGDNDAHFLEEGYVTIVPIQTDMTSFKDLGKMQEDWFNK